MRWHTKEKEEKKKKKSLWICSSCTTMRLNSANNQQDKRKETGDGGFESAGKGRLFSFASDKWGPFPVLFFYAPFPHGALTKPYSQGFKTFKNPAFFLFFFFAWKPLHYYNNQAPYVSCMSIKSGMKMAKTERKWGGKKKKSYLALQKMKTVDGEG